MSVSAPVVVHPRRRPRRRPVVVAFVFAACTAAASLVAVASLVTSVGCWAWNTSSPSAARTRRDVLAGGVASATFLSSALAGGAGGGVLTPSLAAAAEGEETTATTQAAAAAAAKPGGKIRYGTEKEGWMRPKSHGTTEQPVQDKLRYGVSRNLADRIVSYNRRYAEPAGYFTGTDWEQVVLNQGSNEPVTFYDSVTGKPLFVAPVGRTAQELVQESRVHGWPSFRDSEVVWDNVRILEDGETISTAGSHLGHNLPDRKGNRYCINLVSIAGEPAD